MTNEKKKTRLKVILDEDGLTLTEFQAQILSKTGFTINISNLSQIIAGKKKNYTIKTLQIFAYTLNRPMEEICEDLIH